MVMSNLSLVPKLVDLLEHPERVSALPLEAVPTIRGELAKLDTLLQMRVAMAQSNGQGQPQGNGDRLLGVREAAVKLGMSEDYLYRRYKSDPIYRDLTVNNGSRKVLFSERKIDAFIRRRTGR